MLRAIISVQSAEMHLSVLNICTAMSGHVRQFALFLFAVDITLLPASADRCYVRREQETISL